MQASLTPSDLNAVREEKYKARRAEADAFIKGIVSFKRHNNLGATSGSFTFNNKHIWDPFFCVKGQGHYAAKESVQAGATPVEPFEYYGKAFCESQMVTLALAYLDATPPSQSPKTSLDEHPIYKKPTFTASL